MSTMSTYSFTSAISGEINFAGRTVTYDFPAGLVTATEETAPILAYLAGVGIAQETELPTKKSAKTAPAPVEANIENTEA